MRMNIEASQKVPHMIYAAIMYYTQRYIDFPPSVFNSFWVFLFGLNYIRHKTIRGGNKKKLVINRNVSSMHGISTLDGQLNPLIHN
jgi:hypothetical protein